jgi:hypothetical protein
MNGESTAWASAVDTLRNLYGDALLRKELEDHIRPGDPSDARGTGYVVDILRTVRSLMQEPSYERIVREASGTVDGHALREAQGLATASAVFPHAGSPPSAAMNSRSRSSRPLSPIAVAWTVYRRGPLTGVGLRTKPQRCQAIMVAGFTATSASAHRDQTREMKTRRRGRLGEGAAGAWRA